ncbi:Roadblock/LC7 domain-containing protein [Rhizopus microsporus var. microsporus]|uniref:Roadblock/LC7 domain-containing protein n=1 Tax=Rhizopus microsporus var. microsporus TaxID=86635 RepID=A0A1X0QSU3_RHIZD|nr:Roadblock/LC7 domain-containing protein [Rhizopus microsporus var. microsporus]
MEARFVDMCSPHFYNGLLVAAVTDRDGVVLLKCKCKSENAKDDLIESTLQSTFAVTNNQASKLGLGNNNSIISVYDLYQIIQLNDAPLIITLIADASANTGLFMSLGHSLIDLTRPIVEALVVDK